MMKFNPILSNFPEYKPSSTIISSDLIDLSKNENPFDVSHEIKQIFYNKINQTSLNRYPELTSETIRQKIAEFLNDYFKSYKLNLNRNNIVVGNGSDELISYLVKIFDGEEVIVCPPTFEMYEFYSTLHNLKVKEVPLDQNFEIRNLDQKINEKARLIFICSPNNPTGNIQPEDEIIKILEKGFPVVIDEAYADFSKKHDKILRKISKLNNTSNFFKSFWPCGYKSRNLDS